MLGVLLLSRKTSVSAIDGKWHHICATWENTAGSWKFYKDGAVADQGQGLRKGNILGVHRFGQALSGARDYKNLPVPRQRETKRKKQVTST